MLTRKINRLNPAQRQNLFELVQKIIDELPPEAINELLGGYDRDIDKLLEQFIGVTYDTVNFGGCIQTEDVAYLNKFYDAVHYSLLKHNYNYFKSNILTNFRQNLRNLIWGNLFELYTRCCIIAQRGCGKCYGPGFPVLMYDGSIKNVEEVKIGDQVMGPDNKPRNVIQTHHGFDQMYNVTQPGNFEYQVNSTHEFYLKKYKLKPKVNAKSQKSYERIADLDQAKEVSVTAPEYLKKTKYFKEHNFGVRVDGWDLPTKDLLVHPYFLGVWIGDGDRRHPTITNEDQPIIKFLEAYAKSLGLFCKLGYDKWRTRRNRYRMSSRGTGEKHNVLTEKMRALGVIMNKHIPEIYFQSSRHQRLLLLAGLIDSDGHNPKTTAYTLVFSQKNKVVAKNVQRLAWSLGFKASCNYFPYESKNVKGGKTFIYCVNISGDIEQIPLIVKNRPIDPNVKLRDIRCYRLKVTQAGRGEYFGFAVDQDHLFVSASGSIEHNSYEACYAYPLWRLYSYDKMKRVNQFDKDNELRRETCLITNEKKLGREHVEKVIDEIRVNPILREKLNCNNKGNLGVDGIKTTSGSKLHLRSYGAFIRGLHVGACVVDDYPDESSMYSKEQRSKFKEQFYGAIGNIIVENGIWLVSGTPYHEQDLYYDLKNDPSFAVFEFPAVYPDGQLLAPDIYTLEYLLEKQEAEGTLVFAREHLVSPISDAASIFPYEILNTSLIGMENFKLETFVDNYPVKFERVVIGCDFAISGSVSADYTVFTVWGKTTQGVYHLIDIWRKRGATHNEQLAMLSNMDERHRPNKIICESNNFQIILSNMAKQMGLNNIEPFNTDGASKKDLKSGLPSLAAIFERHEIKLPYGDKKSKEVAHQVLSEFNSMTFNQDKGTLESASEKDDIVMSTFMAINNLREQGTGFKAYMV